MAGWLAEVLSLGRHVVSIQTRGKTGAAIPQGIVHHVLRVAGPGPEGLRGPSGGRGWPGRRWTSEDLASPRSALTSLRGSASARQWHAPRATPCEAESRDQDLVANCESDRTGLG